MQVCDLRGLKPWVGIVKNHLGWLPEDMGIEISDVGILIPALAQYRPEAPQTAISFFGLGRMNGKQHTPLIPATLLELETSCWNMFPCDVLASERVTKRGSDQSWVSKTRR